MLYTRRKPSPLLLRKKKKKKITTSKEFTKRRKKKKYLKNKTNKILIEGGILFCQRELALESDHCHDSNKSQNQEDQRNIRTPSIHSHVRSYMYPSIAIPISDRVKRNLIPYFTLARGIVDLKNTR